MDTVRHGFHGRKRRHRDDDDGYDRRNKRRHHEEPNIVKLRRKLLNLSTLPPRQTEEETIAIVTLVTGSIEDEELTKSFAELIHLLIIEQPLKIPILASVVEAVNSKNQDLVEKILVDTCTQLNRSLEQGSWRNVKLNLRFLACLQRTLSGAGIFPILDDLFARAADLQTASAEDGLGLELVKIILLTIAYTMRVSPITCHENALEILKKTEIVASAPHNLDALVNPFISTNKEEPVQCKSFIALLQQQLLNEAANGWPLNCIFHPVIAAEDSKLHELPKIIVPVTATSETWPRLPEVYFSVYTSQDVETVPPDSSIASTIIRDVLVDMMNGMDFNRNAAARALIEVDSFFPENTFASRGMSVDKLRDQGSEKSTWKPEDVAIDAVFSQIAILPNPEHKMVYYHSLLTETCRIAPAAVAPSLGRAIRFLYQKLEYVDIEVAYRFNDWFSHHLSNFGFTWKWTEWVGDLELAMIHPRKAFIIGTLDKEIRLSFSQRIRGTLPEQYLILIPEAKDKDIPDFKFNDESVPYSNSAQEILRLIKQKGKDSEVQGLMSSIEKEALERLAPEPQLVSVDVYTTCICFAGAKSLSHVLNCIERCKERLLAIATNSESARLQIISSVMEYWREKPGVGVNIVDKLLNYTVLTPMSVVKWAFATNLQDGQILAQMPAFEMVVGTIEKVARRIRQIVIGRRPKSLTTQQRDTLDQALASENDQFKQLFIVMEDALRFLANGTNNSGDRVDNIDDDAQKLIEMWARRWLKCSTRKLAIEQSWVTEMMAKPFPGSESDLETNSPVMES